MCKVRLAIKQRGLRPNGYFPLMRQPPCSHKRSAPVNLACNLSFGGTLRESEGSRADFFVVKPLTVACALIFSIVAEQPCVNQALNGSRSRCSRDIHFHIF